MENASTDNNTQSSQTTPLHPYSTVQVVPVQQTYPVKSATPSPTVSKTLSAGIFGFIVVSTGSMGFNLGKVSDGEMTITQAAGDSLVKGAMGGTTAACATAAASSLTDGGVAGLAVTVAAATGVSYMLNRIIS
nr:hypothetical protein [uncultured Desulfobacter sp.]